jgi:hypothetical protein
MQGLTITTHNGTVNLNATGPVLMMAADNMAHLFRDTNPGIDSAHNGAQGANGVALKPAPSQTVLESRLF